MPLISLTLPECGPVSYAFTHAHAWVTAAMRASTDADARVATARVSSILKDVAGYSDKELKGEAPAATLERYKGEAVGFLTDMAELEKAANLPPPARQRRRTARPTRRQRRESPGSVGSLGGAAARARRNARRTRA